MNEKKDLAADDTSEVREPQDERSPTEKIEGEPPPGSRKPGREKPESEVHNEIKPNTE